MLLHGYLAYYSNDAVEAVNGEMAVLYHKHGQKGGSGGRGRGRRTVKHVESMAMHCARYATPYAAIARACPQPRVSAEFVACSRRPCSSLCLARESGTPWDTTAASQYATPPGIP